MTQLVPPTSVSDDQGNTYTFLKDVANPIMFGGADVSLWVKQGCIGGAGKIKPIFASPSANTTIILLEYAGLDTAQVADAVNSAEVGFGTPTVPITTTFPDDLIVGLGFIQSGGVSTSTLTDRSGGFQGGFGIAGDQEQTPAGTPTITTDGTSSAWAIVVAALKIASAPPPSSGKTVSCFIQ